MKGKLREFFPGGNTSLGFYSFYDFIIEPEATRVFCIKGGPGVGKSTFMKIIGKEMLDRGYDVEFHHCSSDASSIDGVVIPVLKIALVDGTTPHIVDPKYPGVVDEIIYLGDFWNEEGLKADKDEILTITKRYKRMFTIAYCSLKESKIIHEEWESYITEAMDFAPINKITRYVFKEVFSDAEPDFTRTGESRHLFGSAITPEGPVNLLESILIDVGNVYVLKGEPGTGKSTFMEKMSASAKQIGLDVEAYHCPLDPTKLDFLVIPALKVAFLNDTEPLMIDLTEFSTTEIDFDQFLDQETLDYYENEMQSCKKRFWAAYNRGVFYINEAKRLHDELEEYYIPNMDFEGINEKRIFTLERILKYAQELE